VNKLTAITTICKAWGVSESDKLDAIQFILHGVDCHKVVQAVDDIQTALGGLETLRPRE